MKKAARKLKKGYLLLKVDLYTHLVIGCIRLLESGLVNPRNTVICKILTVAARRQSEAIYAMIVNGFLTNEQTVHILAIWMGIIATCSHYKQ